MIKKWFKPKEIGELTDFGYSVKGSMNERRKALFDAVKSDRDTGLEVYRKLIALSNVTQNSQPKNSIIYKEDAEYVKGRFVDTQDW